MAQKIQQSDVTVEENRPRVTLWHLSLVCVVIGLLISGYLSFTELTKTEAVCLAGEGFNCDLVQNSVYSKMFGIPVAFLGFATYLFIGALLVFQDRFEFLRENGALILFGVVLFAFVYSLYLVYIQGSVLESWCIWCLSHEVNMTVLFVLTSLRLRNFLTNS
jgi:uncharacterized membrane protein